MNHLFLQKLISSLPQAIFICNGQGQVQYASGNCSGVLGKNNDFFMGNAFEGYPFLQKEILSLIEKCKYPQESLSTLELEVALPQTTEILDIYIENISQPSKAPQFLLTLDKKTNLIEIKSQKTPDFVGHISQNLENLSVALKHEIKNPLAAIKGAAQLSARFLPQDKLKLTDMIVSEVHRISNIVDSMSIGNAAVEDEHQPVNIHETIDYVLQLAKHDENLDFQYHLDLDPSIPHACASKTFLTQVLLNVIKNAVEASSPNSVITIVTRYNHDSHFYAEDMARHKTPIEIQILDNGHGLDQAMEQNLFTPFSTTKEAGRGLGLSICAHLMNKMQGTIQFKNKKDLPQNMHGASPQKGSCFQLNLPLC